MSLSRCLRASLLPALLIVPLAAGPAVASKKSERTQNHKISAAAKSAKSAGTAAKKAQTTATSAASGVAAVVTALAAAQNSIKAIQDAIPGVTTALSQLSDGLKAAGTGINDLKTALTALSSSVTTIGTNLTALGGTVGANAASEAAKEYGVVALFSNTTKVGNVWTPDIPDDSNNAAQASGTAVVTCTAPPCTLTVLGAIRSAETDGTGSADPAGAIGVSLIVHDAAGNLVAAGTTAETNSAYTQGVQAVTINNKVPLSSGVPTSSSDASATNLTPAAAVGSFTLSTAGAYTVTGNVQAFDFSNTAGGTN